MKKLIFCLIFLIIVFSAKGSTEYGAGSLSMTPFVDDEPYGAPYCASRGGGLDGFDEEYDFEMPDDFYPSLEWHHAFMFSHVPGHYILLLDSRPADDSTDIYKLYLGFYGMPTNGQSRINAAFGWRPNGAFENLNVYLISPYLKYGGYICLNHYKQPSEAGKTFHIPMKGLLIGYFYCLDLYAYAFLYISPRELSCICDFDSSGSVDLADFRMLAADWFKPRGCYVADTTGGYDGVPDGYVNVYDLIEFAQNWLLCPVDFDNSGKVDLRDYSILANRWQEGGGSIVDYTGRDGFPDNVVDWYDLAALTKQYANKR